MGQQEQSSGHQKQVTLLMRDSVFSLNSNQTFSPFPGTSEEPGLGSSVLSAVDPLLCAGDAYMSHYPRRPWQTRRFEPWAGMSDEGGWGRGNSRIWNRFPGWTLEYGVNKKKSFTWQRCWEGTTPQIRALHRNLIGPSGKADIWASVELERGRAEVFHIRDVLGIICKALIECSPCL